MRMAAPTQAPKRVTETPGRPIAPHGGTRSVSLGFADARQAFARPSQVPLRETHIATIRRCACGGSSAGGSECGPCSAARLGRLGIGAGGTGAGYAPPLVHEVLRSPGVPLSQADRAEFEQHLGTDFAHVRVHTDERASASASALGARAYAVGSDIVFGPSGFAASSGDRRWLLAHELAHVAQQHSSSVPSRIPIGHADETAEREAERFADHVAGAAPTTASGDIVPPSGDRGAVAAQDGARTRSIPASITRAPAGAVVLRRAKGCFAPSEVVDAAAASPFGTFAEAIVNVDYLSKRGGRVFADVFFDNPLGPMAYVAFLASHHPSLNVPLLAGQIGLAGGVLVPDILDTRPFGGLPEFYDVKPNSIDGLPAGRAKLAAIDAFMSFNKLPYTRGATYVPTPSIPLPITSAALTAAMELIEPGTVLPVVACGVPAVSLEVKLVSPGLLVYRVCVEGDLECYLKVVALEVLLAAIIAAAAAAAAAAAGAAGAVGAGGLVLASAAAPGGAPAQGPGPGGQGLQPVGEAGGATAASQTA